MDVTKPLVIKSRGGKSGARKQWTAFGDNITNFTQGIGYDDNKGADALKPNIKNAVSGIPTVFARANMFTYALLSSATRGEEFGMNSFYSLLLDEWKGLISAFALESNANAWQVKRVSLTYSDGDGSIQQAKNIYEPKGAFGNSLFNRKQLWEDQDHISVKDRVAKPFIDIIYYNGEVVAGTSPESLVFTSPGYEFKPEHRQKVFISETSGKFSDPLNSKGKVTPEELNHLYIYVNNLGKRIKDFYNKYESSKHLWPVQDVDEKLVQFLGDWIKEMDKYFIDYNIPKTPSAKPEVTLFEQEPFKSLFNSSNIYYANFAGSLFSEEDPGRDEECAEFRLEELMLDPMTAELARIDIESTKNLPITALEVEWNGTNLYFTIPLSPLGLRVFQREGKMESLIDGRGQSASSTIDGVYQVSKDGKQKLIVTLNLVKDNGSRLKPVVREYSVAVKAVEPYEMNQLVVWPNFASSSWSKYYMYSEMPHNRPTGWQVFPILGNIRESDNVVELLDKQCGESLGLKEELPSEKYGLVRLAENGTANLKLGRVLVGNIKTLSNFKYEIYESEKPFRGVEIKYSGKSSGFLFLKYKGDSPSNSHIQFVRGKQLKGTRIGVDFGSNNTCIAYFNGEESDILEIKNRRISFFTSDEDQNRNNVTSPADTFEMLFFQNDSIWSNKIKSVLTIHDESRLVADGSSQNIDLLFSEVVKGGITCYEKNVAITDSTDSRYIVSLDKMSDQKIQMVFNMKWKDDDPKEEAHKKAFLKSLLLQVYAELFDGPSGVSFYPNELLWAFPAAMSSSRVTKFSSNVWDELRDCNPLTNKQQYSLHVADQFKLKRKASSSSLSGMSSGSRSGGGMTGAGGGMTGAGGGMTGAGGGMTGAGGGMTSAGGGMTGSSGNSVGSGSSSSASSGSFIPAIYPEEIDPKNQWSFTSPTKIIQNNVLTEAQAVAKYAVISDRLESGKYKIGVDVGGSTSDILILTSLKGDQTLIKQSSIKIAAGLLANSTKYIPGFSKFLKNYVDKKKDIFGEVYAFNDIKESTLPFCFNLILDRLETDEELNKFYKEISVNCKPLMWINLYLTGLTIYYLGMISKKISLISEKHVNDFGGWTMSNLIIDFYGKGARIYDWYKAINKQAAKEYLMTCFNQGFGTDVNQYVTFNNFKEFGIIESRKVKSEVAKGLADINVSISEFETMIGEIAGEDDFVLRVPGESNPVPYSSLMDINPSLIQRLGSELRMSPNAQRPYPRFTGFMDIFFDHARNNFELNFDGQEMLNAIGSMNLLREVEDDEDYKKAKREKEFDFVAPLFILEGQAFLKSYLLPRIKKG